MITGSCCNGKGAGEGWEQTVNRGKERKNEDK